MPEAHQIPQAAFLNYRPIPLSFGTSGLRGLVKDITDLEAYINVKGALRYLLNIGDISAKSGGVVLAGDLRPSTERIMRACAQAILDAGLRVENAGKIPTPALVSYAMSTGRAGVMVSGSHIPFDRNGIKLSKRAGEVLKSDEPGILRGVDQVRAEEYARSAAASAFNTAGMFKHAPDLPPLDSAAEETYVRRYLDGFNGVNLAGWRVLVYQHSAVGRDVLTRILRELGAEVLAEGRSDSFIPIDTENITAAQLDCLGEFAAAAESRGRPLDAIVSTDGDSDRPLVSAVLPAGAMHSDGRRVRFLPGDLLGIVVAEFLGADAAAVPISANDAVERRMNERGILLEKTQIGSPYVVAALDRLLRAGKQTVVGWEANGGFLIGSDIRLSAGTLTALPTRDAMLPILANLFAAAERGIGLAALWNRLPARFGAAGLLDDFPAAASRAVLSRLIPPGEIIEVVFDGAGGVLDRSRAGATEYAALEPQAAADWRRCRETVSRFFTPAAGFADIARINALDGLRIYFSNGDVAHIRPSGNAPQLRVYANSDSQARSDRIVELALEEPDGILRRLERAFA
jgi:phosphomannomutase